MVKKDIFEQVGGFDENLKNNLYDVDLCLQLQNRGYHNILIPEVQAYLNMKKFSLNALNKKKNKEEIFYLKMKWNETILEDPCRSKVSDLDPTRV